jgi:hypothetical protein
MTGVAQTSQELEATSPPVATPAASSFARFSELCPAVMVGFGIVLTIAWTGGLSWLLVSLLRLVV